MTNVEDTFYIIGSAAGPHPYPAMVRDFQAVIGKETREQVIELEGRLPDALVACVGGGSNAIGLFHPFLNGRGREDLRGRGGRPRHAHPRARRRHQRRRPGVLHGNKTYLLQDKEGQILEAHSISAGLDYPGIGPEHSWLHDVGRATYLTATDDEALEAFQLCTRLEGIIPALESAHALARLPEVAREVGPNGIVVLNLSGRGDKDVPTRRGLDGDEALDDDGGHVPTPRPCGERRGPFASAMEVRGC